jgi:hypothetical protein
MKARLPVWRSNFCKEATKESTLLKGAGASGRRSGFRQNRNSNRFLVLSRPSHAGLDAQVRKKCFSVGPWLTCDGLTAKRKLGGGYAEGYTGG